MLRNLSMSRRFNLLNVMLVLVTALCVGFIVTYYLLARQFDARLENNRALAELLAETSEYAVYTRQYSALKNQLGSFAVLPELSHVAISDAHGQVLAEFRRDDPIAAPEYASSDASMFTVWRWWLMFGGQGFGEISVPITSKGWVNEDALFLAADVQPQVIGWVRIAMNLSYFESLLRYTFMWSLIVVLAILMVSVIVSLAMTARITRPLQQLGDAAHNVIDGKLEPVFLDSGGPELQELGAAFNLMTTGLADYRSKVKSYQTMLERQAFYDDLTGLANRTLLKDHLGMAVIQAYRRKSAAAVMFLDLDRFKYINDTLGHSFGDQVLQAVAYRLQQQLRQSDTVARMGGDEFIVIINDLKYDYEEAKRDVGRVAAQIGHALSKPFSIDKHDISTSFSIGIAIYPHDGEDGEILTRNADCAMYEAKEQGRNTYRFYAESLQQRGVRRLQLENGLKHALERNELRVFFQPKYDACNGKLVGAEALLRWHFNGTWISPVEFIPLAEETGLILPIGEWVLNTALHTLAQWRNSELIDQSFHIGVNVSPQQFWHPDFSRRTLEILKSALPGSASGLELELTESCLLRPTEKSQRAFSELREAGIRFAVDDFGTGYSNLSYLKQFPLDVLKIDQSFVRDCIEDPSDATIIRAIIAMARGLGLDVIAEGVENQQHVHFLNEEGCYLLQGYLLAKPMPAEEFVQFCLDFQQHPINQYIEDMQPVVA